jgi:YbbR domain-containing protein
MIPVLRDIFVKDFWLKLFSLVLAVLTWLTVYMTEGSSIGTLRLAPASRRTLTRLPVLIMSSAEDVRSFRVHPKEVDVTVQGDARAVKALQDRDIRVMVDLSGIEAAHDLRKRIEVSTPAGVTHVKVEPDEVQVIFPSRSP